MKILITGGCGFLGSNLVAGAIARAHQPIIFDNLFRIGSINNLHWLKCQTDVIHIHGDIRNPADVENAVRVHRPNAIFHLAGQVAMTTSLTNPRLDFEINALGSINLLEAVRRYVPDSPVIYSSTNKVYGDLEWVDYVEGETRYYDPSHPDGLDEDTPLEFHSPYGCSKGAADQYMLDHARTSKLKTVVFRHSSMYGARQWGTFDQGWVAWFCQQALLIKQGKLTHFTISGNGKQVRDLLNAADMERLYFSALDKIDNVQGQAFNVGGGMTNSLSLLELFAMLEDMLNVELRYTRLPARFSDQRIFVANIGKARRLLGWSPEVDARTGIGEMLDWTRQLRDHAD